MRLVERLTTNPPPERVYRGLVRTRRWLRRLREGLLPADAVLVERTFAAIEIRALGVAAELDLGGRLDGGPRTTAELAAELGLDPDPLGRLLHLLCAADVVRRGRDGRWSATRLGAALSTTNRRSARSWVRFFGGSHQFHLLAELGATVRGGGSAPSLLHDATFFEWTAQDPVVGERFDAAMADGSRLTGPMIAAAVDWSGTGVVCDVGGGTGRVLSAVLGANRHLRGVLFDLPSVVDDAHVPDDLAGRLVTVGGDFFDELPPADTMLLVAVLHDWADDDAARILERCAAALTPGGRVLVVDQVLVPGRPVFLEHHADVLMLLLTEGGRERSVDDLLRLAAPAGLRLGRRWDLVNLQAVELVPATA